MKRGESRKEERKFAARVWPLFPSRGNEVFLGIGGLRTSFVFFWLSEPVLTSVVEELRASSSCNLTDYPGDSSSVSGFFVARRKLVYRRNFTDETDETDETDDRALKTKRDNER